MHKIYFINKLKNYSVMEDYVMRKKIVAGNWKMNYDLAETEMFMVELKKQMLPENVSVMVAPAFTNLHHAFKSTQKHPIEIIGQNLFQEDFGAFTGEVSAKMLKSVGVQTVIVGHSERRSIFGETNSILKKKVDTALENEMQIIFCIGESIEDRNNNTYFELIQEQVSTALFHLPKESWENIVIAYEPVWAIGTGETASPTQVQEMHAFIRKIISEKYSKNLAEGISILYGGSVKPDNAKEIFGQTDVDGGLIGGAALKVDSFMAIINSF